MDKREMQLIMELMEELQDQMKYGEEDFSERLGRKKPEIDVIKVEGKMEDPKLEHMEEELGTDLDDDQEMGEDPEHMEMVLGEDVSPEEKLKQRLMKLRGK